MLCYLKISFCIILELNLLNFREYLSFLCDGFSEESVVPSFVTEINYNPIH